MADQDIIREFLVSLGFKVDEKGLKNFSDTVQGATKTVAGMVAGIEIAALAIGGLVQNFASKAEQLYYSTQRVGTSSSDLKAFGNAARNMGVEAQEAAGSVEAFAAALRNNPGNEGLLASFGIRTREANGQMRSSVDMMVELGEKLQKYDTSVRRQFANSFGLSDRMLLAITDPQFRKELEEQQRLIPNGFDSAIQQSQRFEKALRGLQTRIDGVATSIANGLLQAIGPQMEAATKIFERNAGTITTILSYISVAIVNLGAIVLPILGKIIEGWEKIFGLVKDTGEAINKLLPQSAKDKIGFGTNWVFEKLGIADAVYDMASGGSPKSGQAKTSSKLKPYTKADSDYIIAELMKWGWTKDQAIGITANLIHESSLDPNAVGDDGEAYGLGQWHPERQADFERFRGKGIKGSLADDQIAFINYELRSGKERAAGDALKATTTAEDAARVVTVLYERPKDMYSKAQERAATAVNLSQTTNITVNGSSDPQRAANEIESRQQAVNSDMTRNFENRLK